MPIATRIARLAITRRRRFLPMDGAVFPRPAHQTGSNRRERIQPVGMPVTSERATRAGEIDKFLAFVTVDISGLRWPG
jgi:hypothetical protein